VWAPGGQPRVVFRFTIARADRRHRPGRQPRAPSPVRPGGPRRLTHRPAPQRGSAASVPGRSSPRGRPWLAGRACR
jgi:hypothetical protein